MKLIWLIMPACCNTKQFYEQHVYQLILLTSFGHDLRFGVSISYKVIVIVMMIVLLLISVF